jgi:uncharacterized phage protein gp47/JayE
MPNQLDSEGLQIKTIDEVVSDTVTGLQAIYGTDINVDPSSPDGQLINIVAQAAIDNLELLNLVYSSFSIDSAIGTGLDQRVAINGISRHAGTYTLVDIDVTVDRALSLPGLDADIDNPDGEGFTVSDDTGNQFILAATQTPAGAGTHTYSFRSKVIGAVQVTTNTITTQVTVTLGVVTVNNASVASTLGEDEETDAALKLRRARSFHLASTGPIDAMEAALLKVENVTDVFVAENDTSGSAGGIDAHSIWAIVEGGSDADIGAVIRAKKMPGCGQTGDEEVSVARPDGRLFVAKFDRPLSEDLYIKFTLAPRVAGVTYDTDLIKTQLAAALSYTLNQSANIGDVIVAMFAITPTGMLTEVGVSTDGMTYDETIDPTSYQHKFVVSSDRIEVTV